ncbi:MAG: iron complex transport system substrate-binding protein [Paraburkholderia sp.]|nr:iron complex transport system substrate-binding protein [Paraburkholderia sp.]
MRRPEPPAASAAFVISATFSSAALCAFLVRLAAALALLFPLLAHAAFTVIDDAGKTVTLTAPASRVIALSPHAVELVYAAGGEATLVGAVSYSDYPPAARTLPRVGSNTALDLERIVALKPDLVVVWRHGNDERELNKLRALGIALFRSEPHKLDDVATNLERLGVLLGTEATAAASARGYRSEIAGLRARYAGRPTVSVFYQVWNRPLMTLNGTHIVSDAIALCGGRNVFAGLAPLVPTVSTEAVVAANPELIVTADAGAAAAPPSRAQAGQTPPELAMWREWPRVTAVARGNLFALDGDLINRPGPRLALGVAALCSDLDTARSRRPSSAATPLERPSAPAQAPR